MTPRNTRMYNRNETLRGLATSITRNRVYTMKQNIKFGIYIYMYEIFFGLYSSMETSRIIRLGTRNYILRIAAASQEHVLICITRKVTRPESDMFFFWHGNRLGCCVGGRNRRDFGVGDRS